MNKPMDPLSESRKKCLGDSEENRRITTVGTLAFDTIETPFGKRPRLLGGSANYFSLAASYFVPVHLISIVGRDFPEAHFEELRKRHIDVGGVVRCPDRDSFFWEGRYSYNLNERETLVTALNVLELFQPVLSPEARRSRFIFLGNFDPEIQLSVIDQCGRDGRKVIAMDTMNYWIEHKAAELACVLAKVDVLLVNEAEARQLSGEYDLSKAAYKIFTMGPSLLIIKQGEYGALMFAKSGAIFSAPALPLLNVLDPTGAGDTFAGGFMGYLANSGTDLSDEGVLRNAVIFGSVFSSFVVEDFGMARLFNLSFGEMLKRYEFFKSLVRF